MYDVKDMLRQLNGSIFCELPESMEFRLVLQRLQKIAIDENLPISVRRLRRDATIIFDYRSEPDGEGNPNRMSIHEVETRILDVLIDADHSLPQGVLIKRANISLKSWGHVIKKLLEAGSIRKTKRGREVRYSFVF